MNISRRSFIESMSAFGAVSAFAGIGCSAKMAQVKKPQIALQLYPIGAYTKKVGLEKTLEEVAKIGFKAVEFAGYHNFTAKQIKKMLDDNGLKACGTHLERKSFSPANIDSTLDFAPAACGRKITAASTSKAKPAKWWTNGCMWAWTTRNGWTSFAHITTRPPKPPRKKAA